MWRDVNIWLPQLVWFSQLLREALASSHTLCDSRAWSAAGQPPHPTSQSQGWSQEGGASLAEENQAGEDIPTSPSLLNLSRTNASLQKETFNLLPSVLCHCGEALPLFQGAGRMDGEALLGRSVGSSRPVLPSVRTAWL